MDDNLARVESAVTATASGDLTWGRWTLDCAVALGIAGIRNPLGFEVVRYLSDEPSARNMWGVVLVLAGEMVKAGVPSEGIDKMAWQAFDFWRDSRCTACGGRGVSNIEQAQCQPCAGTGQRSVPSSPDSLRIGIGCLLEAERFMEGQLNARLKRTA